jgi:hypothetical protein
MSVLKYIGFFILLVFAVISCKKEVKIADDVLAQVGGNKLMLSDLLKVLPNNISPEDSLEAAQLFIRSWIDDQLMYFEANKTLDDTLEIHQKVMQYRQDLFVYYYTQKIFSEEVDTLVTAEEIEAYYNTHLEDYLLTEPILKVHYMTMSSQVIGYWEERDKIRTTPLSEINALQEFCKGTGRKIVIIDKWIRLSELHNTINCLNTINDASLQQNNFYECFDDNMRYLLLVDDYLNIGDQAPLELLSSVIKSVIINKRKNDNLNKFQHELFLHAKNNGTLVINN